MLLFARCREVAGASAVEVHLDKGNCCASSATHSLTRDTARPSIKDVVNGVVAAHPGIAPLLQNLVVAVNLNYARAGRAHAMSIEADRCRRRRLDPCVGDGRGGAYSAHQRWMSVRAALLESATTTRARSGRTGCARDSKRW